MSRSRRLLLGLFACIIVMVLFAVQSARAHSILNAAESDETTVGLTSVGHLVPRHNCIHDSVVVPMLKDEEKAFPNATRPIADAPYQLSAADRAAGRTLAVGSLRFVVRTPDLYDQTKYCVNATTTSSNMQGGKMACSDDTVLTDAKRNILLNQLLPEALNRLSAALSVTQVTGNLIVPAGVCSYFTIPAADSMSGVSNADFVLYVAAAPANSGTIAWAGYCSQDVSGRPVVGRMNISPRYIEYQDYYVRVVMHELAHALGFSSAMFLSSSETTTGTIRSKTAKFVTTPNVVAAYRAFTNCSTAIGPEVEDEGGSGTAGSHWERRNLRDDLMAGIAGAGRLSKHTLATFQDSGLYTVNFNSAESMDWGSNAGCSFLNEKCNTVAAGQGKYWCASSSQSCSFDRKAIGVCDFTTYASALPAAFQYFANPAQGGSAANLMDYCPTVTSYSNRQCDNAAYNATNNDHIFGLTFAANGRCFDTSTFIKSGYSAGSYPTQTCLKVRCVAGVRLEVSVWNTDWIACPTSGAAGSVTAPGYSGSISCPAASAFCGDLSLIAVTTTPAPTTKTAKSTLTSTTITTATTTTMTLTVAVSNPNATVTTVLPNTTTTTTTTIAPTPVPPPITPAPVTSAPTAAPPVAKRYYLLVIRGQYLLTIAAYPAFDVSLAADLANAFSTISSAVAIVSKTTTAAQQLTVSFSVSPDALMPNDTDVDDSAFLASSGSGVAWLTQIRAMHRAAAAAAAAAAGSDAGAGASAPDPTAPFAMEFAAAGGSHGGAGAHRREAEAADGGATTTTVAPNTSNSVTPTATTITPPIRPTASVTGVAPSTSGGDDLYVVRASLDPIQNAPPAPSAAADHSAARAGSLIVMFAAVGLGWLMIV